MHSDFKDLLRAFNEGGVEYLIVGGYAVIEYTEPRYTKDLDLWVRPEIENARKVIAALARFKAPLHGLQAEDLLDPDVFFQIGVPPIRIDLLTSIPAVEFGEAWIRRVLCHFDDIEAPLLSREDLILNKEATGRPLDRVDAEELRKQRETGA